MERNNLTINLHWSCTMAIQPTILVFVKFCFKMFTGVTSCVALRKIYNNCENQRDYEIFAYKTHALWKSLESDSL